MAEENVCFLFFFAEVATTGTTVDIFMMLHVLKEGFKAGLMLH